MGQPTAVVRRRRILQAVGLAAGGSSLPTALAAQESDEDRPFVLEQDGECVPLGPLSGDEPVEELYDFTYPMERFEGPPGSEGATFSSHGTTDLQRDDTSILFLYDGPEGLSLVVVHGRLDGAGSGGTVTFTVDGLPSEGDWIVRDDSYRIDGEEAPSNFDRWAIEGERHTIDWAFGSGRTDGGAFRGLDPGAELRIEPAFNEAAALSEDRDFGRIEAWEALSGDRDDPERHSLQLDRPVTIRRGECPAGGDADAEPAGGAVDGRITDVSVAGGSFTPGDVVPAEVTVENTGERQHTFYVGYGAVDPTGVAHHNDGTTDEPVTVGAGETATVTVEWTVETDVPRGSYGAKVALWRDRRDGQLRTRLDRRQVTDAFEVRDAGGDAGTGIDARIVDVSVASGTYVTGDDVRARATVENTGGRQHTFFVGYSAIDPGDTSHSNDGTTGTPVTLASGESTTVTVSWTVERDHPSGVYGAKVIVWQESTRGNLRTQLDDELVEAAFEVA